MVSRSCVGKMRSFASPGDAAATRTPSAWCPNRETQRPRAVSGQRRRVACEPSRRSSPRLPDPQRVPARPDADDETGMKHHDTGDAAGQTSPTDEYDSPWKAAIERYFEAFMAFFFP